MNAFKKFLHLSRADRLPDNWDTIKRRLAVLGMFLLIALWIITTCLALKGLR